MEYERLYIIDPTQPFRGNCENSMSAPKGMTPTHVDYQDTPTTFEEYKIKKNKPQLVIITPEEMEVKIKDYRESLVSYFSEITEERWYDLLEVLPPQRWHTHDEVNLFYMMEAQTMDLHTWCARIKGKYFSAVRPRSESSDSLVTAVRQALAKLESQAKPLEYVAGKAYWVCGPRSAFDHIIVGIFDTREEAEGYFPQNIECVREATHKEVSDYFKNISDVKK